MTEPSIKIEKNVPFPEDNYGSRSKYPFKAMAVGDSFVIPNNGARQGLYSLAARAGMKISIRRDGANIRVWRTA